MNKTSKSIHAGTQIIIPDEKNTKKKNKWSDMWLIHSNLNGIYYYCECRVVLMCL